MKKLLSWICLLPPRKQGQLPGQAAILFTGSGTIFQPWFSCWNLNYCVFCSCCFLAFQFCVFKTNGAPGFSFHTNSSQVSFNKQHPVCLFRLLIMFLTILNCPLQYHLGCEAVHTKTGGKFMPVSRTSCQDSEGSEYSPGDEALTSYSLALKSKEVKAPNFSLLSLWESRSTGPGHLKEPSLLL